MEYEELLGAVFRGKSLFGALVSLLTQVVLNLVPIFADTWLKPTAHRPNTTIMTSISDEDD